MTAAKGFVAAGVEAGIRHAKKDVAIVRSLEPSVGGAMFTRNKVQAACLRVNRAHLDAAEPQAVVINSGIANASTGAEGYANAGATAAHAADLLGIRAEQVLVLSTGVIGMHLPMERLLAGVDQAAGGLDANGGHDAAEAIMTTDTTSKETVVARDGFTVGGMAKGAGMIHPDLATMLSVITTDYPLEPGEASDFLRPAVDQTFNAITIDGDCSTNDTVILLANGASAIERTAESDLSFGAALLEACADLSRQIVADGEGATVLAEIRVAGAVDEEQAKAIAKRIATSLLVKTALFGHDANWGRVLMAAGSAPYNGGFADIDGDRATLRYNDTIVLDRGSPTNVEPDVAGPSCTIALELGLGDGSAAYLTSDLSYDYVRINADYRS
ncbi:MAG: bifunctional glutamate N-acetyltransferase/amino-acid acetyltransferase ArgJ [Gaiellaceae bacterium]